MDMASQVIPVHVTKPYVGVEAKPQVFLTSALHRGECSAPCTGHLYAGKETS